MGSGFISRSDDGARPLAGPHQTKPRGSQPAGGCGGVALRPAYPQGGSFEENEPVAAAQASCRSDFPIPRSLVAPTRYHNPHALMPIP